MRNTAAWDGELHSKTEMHPNESSSCNKALSMCISLFNPVY